MHLRNDDLHMIRRAPTRPTSWAHARRRATAAVVALACACTCLATTPAHAQPLPFPTTDSPAPNPDALFLEARALVQERKLEAALEKLRQAYALKQSHDIVGNLGVVESELGLDVAAIEHLELALRSFPVTGKAESRAVLETRLADVKKRVGIVTIRVDRSGAEVFWNGQRLGATPLAAPLVVEPRQHQLEVRMTGYRTARVWVVPGAGTESTVELKLDADAGSLGLPGSSSATAPRGAGGGAGTHGAGGTSGFDAARPWLVGASSVLLVAGVVFGITGTVLASGHDATIDELAGQLPSDSSCLGEAIAGVCLPLGQEVAYKNAANGVAAGGFITAGIGLALGLTFLLIPGGGADSPVEAALGPGGGSARVRF